MSLKMNVFAALKVSTVSPSNRCARSQRRNNLEPDPPGLGVPLVSRNIGQPIIGPSESFRHAAFRPWSRFWDPDSGGHRLYVGVDIIEIERIGLTYSRYPLRFLEKIYTPGEQAYCRGRAPQLASRFAAKEAVMKALGTGVRGVGWRDIEVQRKRGRAPEIVLHDRAKARAEKMGITRIAISLSHSRDFAVASVVAESDGRTFPA